jgi:hypothetical protein
VRLAAICIEKVGNFHANGLAPRLLDVTGVIAQAVRAWEQAKS